MGEFNVGDKVLAEVKIVGEDIRANEYQVKPAKNTWTFWAAKDKLYPLADKDEEVPTKTYEDGLLEAWELSKKIICNIEYGGLHTSELEQIFGYAEFDDVLKNYTPQEAAAKIAEWEKKQGIHVGDVLYDRDTGKEVIVSRTELGNEKNIFVIYPDGSCGKYEESDFVKTGRTIDIAGLLAQIGGVE